jgi:hypothetical protein
MAHDPTVSIAKASLWSKMSVFMAGAPAERPVEERAALIYTLALALAGLTVAPTHAVAGIPGPWVLLGGIITVQCGITWWLFRTRRVGRAFTAVSIAAMGMWAIPWYYLHFDGIRGPASIMSLAIVPPLLILVKGPPRIGLVTLHFVMLVALWAIEWAHPEWVANSYPGVDEQQMGLRMTLFEVSALLVTVVILYSRQYEYRVEELSQERKKVSMLLNAIVPERDRLAEQVRIQDDVTARERVAAHLANLKPKALIGRYRLLKEVGKGGMSKVYLAQHSELGTRHALKVITSPDPLVQKRLLREGHAQATLKSPHIAAVTDTVIVGGFVGLVMDYQNGGTLARRLRKSRLSIDQVDTIATQLLTGMAHAHDLGVVHRDLKPSNILFHDDGDKELLRIADFGLVKLLDRDDPEPLTETGIIIGTPAYISPEQIASSADVDQRTDVWALGCVLYEMLTGKKAFTGDTMQILRDVTEGDVAPLPPNIPKRMRDAVARCLEPDRENRLRTAQDVLQVWTAAGA